MQSATYQSSLARKYKGFLFVCLFSQLKCSVCYLRHKYLKAFPIKEDISLGVFWAVHTLSLTQFVSELKLRVQSSTITLYKSPDSLSSGKGLKEKENINIQNEHIFCMEGKDRHQKHRFMEHKIYPLNISAPLSTKTSFEFIEV